MITMILCIPFCTALIQGMAVFYQQQKKALQWLGVLGLLVSFGCTVSLMHALPVQWIGWDLLGFQGLSASFGLKLDSLSLVFVLMVCLFGALIQAYSIEYFQGKSALRFFCYVNLFCGFMLLLVMGSSLPVLFFGWEGVGLCSFLLIGYDLKSKVASMKAFVFNRIGDLGLLILMAYLLNQTKSLDFDLILPALKASSGVFLKWAPAFLFFACSAKSAQIPLYLWLPDAMAGPTPASALIHAATMVTSGLYLFARLAPWLLGDPQALVLFGVMGGLTAFLAACFALFQNDLKKILAYSTMSQLGFMFLACGAGAPHAAVFHVLSHACFKALLFLAAGSFLHHHAGLSIQTLGNLQLQQKYPKTFWCFTIGVFGLCGIPPLSGFFSKESILLAVEFSTSLPRICHVLGYFATFLTSVYMGRLFFILFGAKPQNASTQPDGKGHPESNSHMRNVLIFLAILSIVFGWVGGLPGFHAPLVVFLGREGAHPEGFLEMLPGILTGLFLSCLGGVCAYVFFGKKLVSSAKLFEATKPLSTLLAQKAYLDELALFCGVKPLTWMAEHLFAPIQKVIESCEQKLSHVAQNLSYFLRSFSTGALENGIWIFIVGIISSLSLAWVVL